MTRQDPVRAYERVTAAHAANVEATARGRRTAELAADVARYAAALTDLYHRLDADGRHAFDACLDDHGIQVDHP